MIWLDSAFAARLESGWKTVDDALKVQGEVFREPEGAQRRTLRFESDGEGYFIKQHWGVGWKEIFKNLLVFKRPVLSAENEWLAINRLNQLQVDTMELVSYGVDRWNPAKIRSFVVTRELRDTISLEDYCVNWAVVAPRPALKWQLVKRVAEMSAKLHDNGVNHRDLYICHFLLQLPWSGSEKELTLYLIDLHRVQIRRSISRRWLVRDLGALYFSAMNIGLTQRDILRFIRCYRQQSLRDSLIKEAGLWQAVETRALQLGNRKLKD